MKRFTNRALIVVGLLLAFAGASFAQSAPTMSTLAAAYSATATTLTISSTTSMTTTVAPGLTPYLLIDGELMRLLTVPVSGTVTVRRAQGGSIATNHASGVYVVYGVVAGTSWDQSATGSPTYGTFLARGVRPYGACTYASQQYSTVFSTVDLGGNPDARAYQCNGVSWNSGPWPAPIEVTAIRQCTIQTGSLALTAYGTDATRVDGTIYVGSIDIPTTRVVTVASSLTGTTSPTTDKQIFAVYNRGGKLIASTALGGVAAATADIFFDQNLLTPTILVPGRYFFGLQLNGATTTIQMVATGTGYVNLVGDSRTGTFGTLAAITPPTTLTTSTAPIGCLSGAD